MDGERSSMRRVRACTFEVMEDMEEERTASSSRRSAKLRERSRGRESRVWVYSESRDRVYAVARASWLALIGVMVEEGGTT